MVWNYLQLFREIGWGDILDICLTTLLVAVGVHVLRSSRTRAVSIGVIFFAGIFFAANRLELKLTSWMLQGLAAVFVLILVVVYQEEIRRFLEQFPNQLLLSKINKREFHAGVAELLIEALKELSSNRRGALIILPGRESIDGLINGGVVLDGQLSKALLLSIFDPNSPGHDGALIVREDRVSHFGVHLPLSEQREQLRDRGTRHAAALGLAEQSDALVLVVSEETARVSVAEQGKLQVVSVTDSLAKRLDDFLQRHAGEKKEPKPLGRLFGSYSVDMVVGLFTALLLWLVLVPGSVVVERVLELPVRVQNIPEGYRFIEVTPATVAVTLKGERRALFLLDQRELEINLDGTLTRFGRKTFSINKSHLLLPETLDPVRIEPEQVRVQVEELQ